MFRAIRGLLTFTLSWLCLLLSDAYADIKVDWEVTEVRGWKLHINPELKKQQPEKLTEAISLLEKMLDEIIEVVPNEAVVELKKVPLYFNTEYPGVGSRAEYHPGAGWLRDNDRDPTMVKGIEFTNISNFLEETKRMPNFALHELAHAYHDRFLERGFDNRELAEAFKNAKESGKYERVERSFGNGRPNSFERAYAMTNPQEYFAECTEAMFSRNDFFPFNRDELKRHDEEMFDLLKRLWKTP